MCMFSSSYRMFDKKMLAYDEGGTSEHSFYPTYGIFDFSKIRFILFFSHQSMDQNSFSIVQLNNKIIKYELQSVFHPIL
jgi:hypothetical protein